MFPYFQHICFCVHWTSCDNSVGSVYVGGVYVGSVYVGSVYVGGYGALSESGLFRELCPVSFLVVGEIPSLLL